MTSTFYQKIHCVPVISLPLTVSSFTWWVRPASFPSDTIFLWCSAVDGLKTSLSSCAPIWRFQQSLTCSTLCLYWRNSYRTWRRVAYRICKFAPSHIIGWLRWYIVRSSAHLYGGFTLLINPRLNSHISLMNAENIDDSIASWARHDQADSVCCHLWSCNGTDITRFILHVWLKQ